jgi:hypothetical protein
MRESKTIFPFEFDNKRVIVLLDSSRNTVLIVWPTTEGTEQLEA